MRHRTKPDLLVERKLFSVKAGKDKKGKLLPNNSKRRMVGSCYLPAGVNFFFFFLGKKTKTAEHLVVSVSGFHHHAR